MSFSLKTEKSEAMATIPASSQINTQYLRCFLKIRKKSISAVLNDVVEFIKENFLELSTKDLVS